MASHNDRASALPRLLDAAGLLTRHPSLRPEAVLVAEQLECRRDERGCWRLYRQLGSALGAVEEVRT